MNAKHTPGPWNCFSDGRIFAAKHGDVENIPFVGEAFVGYSTIPSDVARANAKLMAAAPDLLAALIFAESALAARMASCSALPTVRAAIAKATGGAA